MVVSTLRLAAVLLVAGLTAVCPLPASAQNGPLVVGHRGLVHAAPENTLAAFRACLALRLGFEFDVRRTSDGQLVCVHDDTVERTTDGTGSLAKLTGDQLRKLDAGSWFGPAFRGEGVPTIAQILQLIAAESRGNVLLAVDLKAAGPGVDDELVRLARDHQVLDRLLFIGLSIESPEIRARLRSADRQCNTSRLSPTAADISAAIADASANWVYLRFLPAAADVERIHAAGKRIFIAGPLVAGEEPENWYAATRLGIDAILTDYPLELAAQGRTYATK